MHQHAGRDGVDGLHSTVCFNSMFCQFPQTRTSIYFAWCIHTAKNTGHRQALSQSKLSRSLRGALTRETWALQDLGPDDDGGQIAWKQQLCLNHVRLRSTSVAVLEVNRRIHERGVEVSAWAFTKIFQVHGRVTQPSAAPPPPPPPPTSPPPPPPHPTP